MNPMEDPATVGGPGWVPLVIVIVLFIAVFFLWRSMRRMLRTIDPELPHKADVEGDERTGAVDQPDDGSTERAVDRARRGEAPKGTATGLVSPDRDESGASRS